MKFTVPWLASLNPAGEVADFVPALTVMLIGEGDCLIEEAFIIDSGADISMSSRQRCDELGLNWESGRLIVLHGISAREECAISARIHEIEVVVPDAECSLIIPICFADCETTSLLGRSVFFDAFRIEFDKSTQTTSLELLQ